MPSYVCQEQWQFDPRSLSQLGGNLGGFFAVIHRNCPDERTKHDDSPEEAAERKAEWERARVLITRFQRDFVTRLYFGLRDAGNRFLPDLAVLEYYFGRKTIVAISSKAWSSLPHKQKP